MNLDDLLDGLHRDQLMITAALREKIDAQREDRREASLELIATLKEQTEIGRAA